MKRWSGAMIIRIVRLALYVLVVSAPLLVEHVGDTPDHDRTRPFLHALSSFVLGAPIRYQDVTHLGFRHPMPHLVQIVRLGKDKPLDLSELCQRRLFLAKLLEKIEAAHPALIVLDIFFGEETCPPGDPGTLALQKAIATSSIPVVVALYTFTPSEYEDSLHNPNKNSRGSLVSQSEFQNADAARLVLRPNLKFDTSNRANIPGNLMIENAGLPTCTEDIRQIPLKWPVYEVRPNGNLGAVVSMPSLSLTAAEIYESEVSNGYVSARLRGLEYAETFPFITDFLPEKTSDANNGIPVTDALASFCGKSSHARDWTQCSDTTSADLRSLAPIVVVGQRYATLDIHETPRGMMLGDMVQANYIEALLEEKYITPVSPFTTLMLNIGWVIVVELIFLNGMTLRAFRFATFATLAVLAIAYCVLLEWGYFLVFWTLALAIFSPAIRALEEVKHFLAHWHSK